MKNIYKSFALLCMGLAATACLEENFGNIDKPFYEVVPGEDIVFSATAGIANGGLKTRTEYGDVYQDDEGKKHVEVKWLVDDKLEIASEQSPIQKAVYNVTKVATSTTAGKHNVSTLEKVGDTGLQWSDAPSYDFYAMYPSAESFEKGSVAYSTVNLDLNNKSITGYIAQDQKPTAVTPQISNGVTVGYVAEPDMRYAYMTAKRVGFDPTSANAISLDFQSVVTALQFDITAGEVTGNSDNQETGEITITSVILQTASIGEAEPKHLCGTFTSSITNPENSQVANDGEDGSSQIVVNLGAGCTISDDQYVDVTFFVLPQEYAAKELKLTVYYIQDGVQQNKTATINQPLQTRKKYNFDNMVLPVLGAEVTGSTWFSNLDGDILVSQLSLPIAGNVFATQAVSDYNVAEKNCQQVLSYTDLWKMGVRGFEFVNQSTAKSTGSLGGQKFVCAENVLNNTPTFSEAFTYLTDQLYKTQETLVLLCTYQAANDGFNPNIYVANLLNFLESFVGSNNAKFKKDNFVQINKNTTVKDLQGNIAIIIRPGDDDRYESEASTSDIDLGDWAENLTLIADWGTAFDVWDRRYTIDGKTPAREATFDDLYVPTNGNSNLPRPQVESWLYGVSSNQDSYLWNEIDNNFNASVEYKPVLRTGGFDYEHITNPKNKPGKAFVQEWTRVVPMGTKLNEPVIDRYSGYGNVVNYIVGSYTRAPYMWVRWYESITEKKNAIKTLFEKSVTRDEDNDAADLYINVLSGYYVDNNIKESYQPFKKTISGNNGARNIEPKDQGKGGNYKQLAKDLNKYTYELLNATPGTEGALSQEGPWGLVMIDHIGLADDGGYSQMLVNLIMMNNFKFPLDKAEPCSECGKYPCECKEDNDTDLDQGGDAI